MSDMTREQVLKLLSAELEKLGLTRLVRMFGVEHNVPRGTHKEQGAAGGVDAETLQGHPASDFIQTGQAVTPAAHAASHQASGSDVVDADTLDTKHAAAFADSDHNHDSAYAPLSKGVTNGDSHDHNGGDGAQIPEGGLSLSDVTTGDVSITKHGFCPRAPNDTSKFLRGDGIFAAPAGGAGLGYVLAITSTNITTMTDAATYYFSGYAFSPATTADQWRLYIPKGGTIKAAHINMFAGTTVGSSESISMYIRLNNSSDTLIASVASAAANRPFSNAGLSISVAAGDYIEIKLVCPTWATNPAGVRFCGSIYIE